MSRITITRRHTGRYYIGLGQDDFFALYGQILLAEGAQIFGVRKPLGEHEQRVVKAFKLFAAEIKAKGGGQ